MDASLFVLQHAACERAKKVFGVKCEIEAWCVHPCPEVFGLEGHHDEEGEFIPFDRSLPVVFQLNRGAIPEGDSLT